MRSDDSGEALVEFARINHFTQIVVGSSHRGRWQELWGGRSIAREIARLAAGACIDVHIIARRNVPLESDQMAEPVDES